MTTAATPSFSEFLTLKSPILAAQPSVLDCTETRMAQVLQPHLADPLTLNLPPLGYRCHVARDWLAYFGLPADLKDRVLVTQGVRHSLTTLFELYAGTGKRVLLPTDVYPVYLALAQQTELNWVGYEAWHGFEDGPPGDADVLLLTNPLKPKGTRMSAQDAEAVLRWLRAAPGRRAVVDAVYTFEPRLDPMTRRLYEHGQTAVLHSLSKGWAQPLVAGVALVPAQDVAELTNVFRGLAVDRERLSLAEGLLARDGGRPELLAHVLACKAQELRERLAKRGVPLPPSLENPLPGQYLFAVAEPWEQLLQQYSVLALPLSVFGSARPGCVLSSLSGTAP